MSIPRDTLAELRAAGKGFLRDVDSAVLARTLSVAIKDPDTGSTSENIILDAKAIYDGDEDAKQAFREYIGAATAAAGENIRATVADEAARFALTTADVQNGDFVLQTDTGVLYEVTDDANLDSGDGYTPQDAIPMANIAGLVAALADKLPLAGGTLTGALRVDVGTNGPIFLGSLNQWFIIGYDGGGFFIANDSSVVSFGVNYNGTITAAAASYVDGDSVLNATALDARYQRSVETKADTGDYGTGNFEGRQVINTFDSTFKIYADGAWRQLATW